MPVVRAPPVALLGPGSVSSLLKVVLDVVYVALILATAAAAVGVAALLLAAPFKISHAPLHVRMDQHDLDFADLMRDWPRASALLAGAGLYLAALCLIFNRLRRVFETLIAGDPFRPENVGRLRLIGAALIACEAIGNGVRLLAGAWIAQDRGLSLNLTAWFAILVVFVLAEVFREGARLRRDAELTI